MIGEDLRTCGVEGSLIPGTRGARKARVDGLIEGGEKLTREKKTWVDGVEVDSVVKFLK